MIRLRIGLCGLAIAFAAVLCLAGERILFLRIGPAEANLYISNADGTGEQPLAKSGSLDYDPSWSPKGDWIAFTSERGGSADIYRVHPDGSELERLTDNPAYDDQAAFSPDEKEIVFVSTRAAGTANLWLLDVATKKAMPLTSARGGDFRPAWSPDGKWIAFSSDRESDLPPAKGRWERLQLLDLYVIHPDGTGLKRVSEHGSVCGGPKWMSNSKSVIAYCMSAQESWTLRFGDTEGENKIIQFDIATGESKPLAAGAGVKFSPAALPGGEIGFVRFDKKAQGVFYASGKKGPEGEDVRGPTWSPDGSKLAYSRYKWAGADEPRKLWSRDPKFELYKTKWLPAGGPASDRFATTSVDGDGHSTLMVKEDGKPTETILKLDELMLGPQWSPDGNQIIFGVGHFELFVEDVGKNLPQVGIVNADGTGFRTITSGPNNNAFPSFAPDGRRIVYRTQGPDGQGLRIMNLEDHSVKVLTKDYDNFPVWSPRGDLIGFVRKSGNDFNIFTIHPDGSAEIQLTHTKGNDAHFSWSPDGEYIVFTSSRMGFKDEVMNTFGGPQPYGEIFVMRYDGTQVEQLTDNQWEDGGPAWLTSAVKTQAAAPSPQ